MLSLLFPLLLLLHQPSPLSGESSAYRRVIETAPRRSKNGLICSETFLWHRFPTGASPTVMGARALCDDFARNAAILGRPQPWTTMRLRDLAHFFDRVRKRYDRTPVAKTFSFFVESSNLCFSVAFKAYPFNAKGDTRFSNMAVKFFTSTGVDCPLTDSDSSITHVACTAVNCTRLPTPPPTLPPSETLPEVGESRPRPCLLLGEDAVTMSEFRETRLTYIIALVGCNLLSFAFLAAAIHYCLKWRHQRRLYRMARSAGSLVTASSPPAAVRHLGTTGASANGSGAIGGSVTLPPYAGAYPDYHYSSIARRKALHNQQMHHPRQDDDMLSYRSDHTQLLMKGSVGGTLQRQAAPPSSLRHGAISPPRGWGNSEPPSTPGSIRRNGSISQMSMTSTGHAPRRNGSLPAPPHPPPPPPINGGGHTFRQDSHMSGF